MRKASKNMIFFLSLFISLLLTINIIFNLFINLEERICTANYEREFPGDCGQFVIWESACFNNQDYCNRESLLKFSLEENPFVLMTGPLTIKESLKEIGISSAYYNNFSIEELKQKLDEGKIVIIMMNVGESFSIHHYFFIKNYKEENNSLIFYFTDAYYYLTEFYKTGNLEPLEVNSSVLEEIRTKGENQSFNFVGLVESSAGMEKFAIVLGESEDKNMNKKIYNMFLYQHLAEKIALYAGKIVMFFSDKV